MPKKKTTAKEIAYRNEYNRRSYDRVTILLPKGERSRIQGLIEWGSVSAYIVKALYEKLERDKKI